MLQLRAIRQLVTGNILIQVVSFAFYPIITRIYPSEVLGEFGVTMAICQMIGLVTTGQYYMGAVGEKSENRIDDLVSASLVLSLIFFICIYVATFFTTYSLYIPLVILTYGLAEIFKIRSYRLGQYNQANLSIFLNRLSSQIIKLIGYGLPFSSTLLASEFIGNIVGFVSYIRFSFNFNLGRAVGVIKTDLRFPLIFLPNNLFFLLLQEFPILYLGKYFGLEVTGNFFIFHRVVILPLTLLGNILATSFMKVVADQKTEIGSVQFLRRILFFLTAISVPVSVFLLCFGDVFFSIFFGNEYAQAGKFASMLWFIVPFKFMKGLATISIINSNKFKETLILRGVNVLTVLGLLGLQIENFKNFILVYYALECVFDVFVLIKALSHNGPSPKSHES